REECTQYSLATRHSPLVTRHSSLVTDAGESFADGCELVPGGLFGAVAHGAFVGFAAGQHDVSGPGQFDSEGDGLVAVVDLPEVYPFGAALCLQALGYLRRDLLHPLGA